MWAALVSSALLPFPNLLRSLALHDTQQFANVLQSYTSFSTCQPRIMKDDDYSHPLPPLFQLVTTS